MRIPKQFKLGGIIWKVILTNHLLNEDDEEMNGLTRSSDHSIILSINGIDKQEFELTFLHELSHAILRSFNPYIEMISEDDEEGYAQTFALGYYNFLMDNYDTDAVNTRNFIDTCIQFSPDYEMVKRVDSLNCQYVELSEEED